MLRNSSPLVERDFRLLPSAWTISFLGNSFAIVALGVRRPRADRLRRPTSATCWPRARSRRCFLLVGGIWSDRLPRHRVMVVSNVVSGASQAAIAILLFSGHAEIWEVATLTAVAGASSAFFFPASSGIVPQTVPRVEAAAGECDPAARPQRLDDRRRGARRTRHPRDEPGHRDRDRRGIVRRRRAAHRSDAHPEERADARGLELLRRPRSLGWREFTSRTWLWAIVLQFGVVNAVEQGASGVLGPAISKEHFSGALGWGLIPAAESAGLIAGGLILLRRRPERILLVATFGVLLTCAAAAGPRRPRLPFGAVLGFAFLAGIGVETFGILWDTAMQQEIPAGPPLARLLLRRASARGRSCRWATRSRDPSPRRWHANDPDGRRRVQPAGDRGRAVRAGGAAPAPAAGQVHSTETLARHVAIPQRSRLRRHARSRRPSARARSAPRT